jgi:hypothetical protein
MAALAVEAGREDPAACRLLPDEVRDGRGLDIRHVAGQYQDRIAAGLIQPGLDGREHPALGLAVGGHSHTARVERWNAPADVAGIRPEHDDDAVDPTIQERADRALEQHVAADFREQLGTAEPLGRPGRGDDRYRRHLTPRWPPRRRAARGAHA